MSLAGASAIAQAKVTNVPDAQVEADVLKALAANPKLSNQTITSTTVYGTVTLSGSVRDEDSRKLAETIVSRTAGVQKVIDELTLNADAPSASQQPDEATGAANDNRSNPLLQSDGTLATQPTQQGAEQPPAYGQNQPPQTAQQPSYGQQSPNNQQSGNGQQPYGQQPQDPYSQQPYSQQQQPYNGQQQPYSQQQQPYGQPQANAQQAPYPPANRTPYGQSPYGPPSGYQQPSAAPYGAQPGGVPVNVPGGSMLRVRINQGLDSKHTQPGTNFEAVVLNDVVADGFVAIPRGATVQGTVIDAERAGALKGLGELSLQLNAVTLGGRTFPIASDVWSNTGGDKTGRTVNSAIGLGAVGAIIGGVTGGGAGAAIGAGLGGAAGVVASAASGGGQAYIPSEAILTFHLTHPAELATVSQAEMDRLGYGVQAATQQMRRRYATPPPPAYGYPVYYPRYPYPY